MRGGEAAARAAPPTAGRRLVRRASWAAKRAASTCAAGTRRAQRGARCAGRQTAQRAAAVRQRCGGVRWRACESSRTTSSEERTARPSSSSLAWPGSPKAIRKRVPTARGRESRTRQRERGARVSGREADASAVAARAPRGTRRAAAPQHHSLRAVRHSPRRGARSSPQQRGARGPAAGRSQSARPLPARARALARALSAWLAGFSLSLTLHPSLARAALLSSRSPPASRAHPCRRRSVG